MKDPCNFNAVKWRNLCNLVGSLDWKEKSYLNLCVNNSSWKKRRKKNKDVRKKREQKGKDVRKKRGKRDADVRMKKGKRDVRKEKLGNYNMKLTS